MGCAITTLGVTVVLVTNSHKSLAAAHATYAHEHNIRLNIMAQNNNIAVQDVAHVLTLLVMSVRLHVRRQYSHAIALP